MDCRASTFVVVSDSYRGFTSRIAELTWVPESTIQSIRPTNSIAVISWNSVAGQMLRLQYKDGMSGTNWHDVAQQVMVTAFSKKAPC